MKTHSEHFRDSDDRFGFFPQKRRNISKWCIVPGVLWPSREQHFPRAAGLELDTLHLKVLGLLPVGTMQTEKGWGVRRPLHHQERLGRSHGCCAGLGRERGSCWGLAVSWPHQGLRVGVQTGQLEGRLPAQVPQLNGRADGPSPLLPTPGRGLTRALVPGQAWSYGSTLESTR